MSILRRKFSRNVVLATILALCGLLILNFALNLDKRLAWSVYSALKSDELFSGAILITKDGRTLYENSDSIEERQFLVASITKQTTAALILKEVEKGSIDLSAKANDYLLKDQKINDAITVSQLLSHTSGVVSDDPSPRFIPGTNYEYSNYGYIVLGRILQNVSGQIFDELAMEMFKNLGMKNSFLIDDKSLDNIRLKRPRFAPSFLFKDGELTKIFATYKFILNKERKMFFPGNPCGGLISTARDLDKWNAALHNGKILSPKMYEKMIKKITPSNIPKGEYGYGICMNSDFEVFHTGCVDGYRATLSYFPKHKISLAILENVFTGKYEADFKTHENIRNIVKKYAELLENEE
jgi:CubicO group peptidase (beta-lactamase class C family)